MVQERPPNFGGSFRLKQPELASSFGIAKLERGAVPAAVGRGPLQSQHRERFRLARTGSGLGILASVGRRHRMGRAFFVVGNILLYTVRMRPGLARSKGKWVPHPHLFGILAISRTSIGSGITAK